MVVLFMGDWCTICHSEIPPLAAKIKELQAAHSALGRLPVIGVDSEDTLARCPFLHHVERGHLPGRR